MSEFTLLEHLRELADLLKGSETLSFSELKIKTKQFKELHAKVTEQIWSLNLQIANSTGDAVNQLKKERDELKKNFSACNSQKAITDLLKMIKDKEGVNRDDGTLVCSPFAL